MRQNLITLGEVSAEDQSRFWSRVTIGMADECWPFDWVGADGYGKLWIKTATFRANRVAWALANREEPAGIVCHSCDNPACCNPAHLWVGDDKSNMDDCAYKRRHRGQNQTHCANGHPYTPENTYHRPGTVAGRDCRTCIRERVRRYKRALAA